jgi:hypothetical protein
MEEMNDYKRELEELKAKIESKNTPCPNCGYCPCCGRPYHIQQYPTYPFSPTNPYWGQPMC